MRNYQPPSFHSAYRFLSNILILPAIIFCLTGCADPKAITESKIRAVKTEMSPAEVKAILGEPQEVETTSTLQFNAEYHRYTGAALVAGIPSSMGAAQLSVGILYVQDKVWRIDTPAQAAAP